MKMKPNLEKKNNKMYCLNCWRKKKGGRRGGGCLPRGMGRRSMDCLRASQLDWRWLQKLPTLLLNSDIVSSISLSHSVSIFFFTSICFPAFVSFKIKPNKPGLSGWKCLDWVFFGWFYYFCFREKDFII